MKIIPTAYFKKTEIIRAKNLIVIA
jgi:hypothetical protein